MRTRRIIGRENRSGGSRGLYFFEGSGGCDGGVVPWGSWWVFMVALGPETLPTWDGNREKREDLQGGERLSSGVTQSRGLGGVNERRRGTLRGWEGNYERRRVLGGASKCARPSTRDVIPAIPGLPGIRGEGGHSWMELIVLPGRHARAMTESVR